VNSEELIRESIPAVYAAGEFLLKELQGFDRNVVDEKSANQLVSYVDVSAEKMLVEALRKLSPESGFITEENTIESNRNAAVTWIIDPLDGTTNFIHGLPVFSISVGLQVNGMLCGGIVYEVNRNELFSAWEDGPAYLNNREISVSSTSSLKDSLLATGFPYYDYELMDQYLGLLRELMKGSRGLRRMGSAAVDLAYVACGRFDAFFEYSLNAWDVAGGAFIVQQAGGKLSDFSGGRDYLFGREMVACNTAMYQEFLQHVKGAFKP